MASSGDDDQAQCGESAAITRVSNAQAAIDAAPQRQCVPWPLTAESRLCKSPRPLDLTRVSRWTPSPSRPTGCKTLPYSQVSALRTKAYQKHYEYLCYFICRIIKLTLKNRNTCSVVQEVIYLFASLTYQMPMNIESELIPIIRTPLSTINLYLWLVYLLTMLMK